MLRDSSSVQAALFPRPQSFLLVGVHRGGLASCVLRIQLPCYSYYFCCSCPNFEIPSMVWHVVEGSIRCGVSVPACWRPLTWWECQRQQPALSCPRLPAQAATCRSTRCRPAPLLLHLPRMLLFTLPFKAPAQSSDSCSVSRAGL